MGPYDDMPCECRQCGEKYDLKDCFNEVYWRLEARDRIDDMAEFWDGDLCPDCNMDEWYAEMVNMMRRHNIEVDPNNIKDLADYEYGN